MKTIVFFILSAGSLVGCLPPQKVQQADVAAAALSPGQSNTFESLSRSSGWFDGSKKLGPDPLKDLMGLLAPLGKIAYTVIPHGRSLQAPHTDYKNPRIVFAISDQKPSSLVLSQSTLFFGYAPKANQVEVISFNEAMGQYDFQIISDFKPNGSPQLETPSRQICISCHQSGLPIFSVDPWSETSSAGVKSFTNSRDEIVYKKLVETLGKEEYLGLSLKRFDSYQYLGTQVQHDSEILNNTIIHGPKGILAVAAAWRECLQNPNIMGGAEKEVKECRLRLLMEILNRRFRDPAASRSVFEKTMISVGKGVGLVDPTLENRLPDLLTALFKSPTKAQDPRSARFPLTTLDTLHSLPLQVAFWSQDKLTPDSLSALLDKHQALRILDSAQFPFSALHRLSINAPLAPQNTASTTREPLNSKTPPSLTEEQVRTPGLKLLLRHCVPCHGSSTKSSLLQFLSGDTEAQVLALVKKNMPLIKTRLLLSQDDPRVMPAPSPNSQEFFSDQKGFTHAQRVKNILKLEESP